MERRVVEAIIREEFAKNPDAKGLLAVRKKVSMMVIEKLAGPNLSEEKRLVLAEVMGLEDLLIFIQRALFKKDAGLGPVDPAKFASMYEKSISLCEFLYSDYEQMSSEFRAGIPPDALANIISCLKLRTMVLNGEIPGLNQLPLEDLSLIENLSSTARLELLGNELDCYFLAECNDAMEVLRLSPEYRDEYEKLFGQD